MRSAAESGYAEAQRSLGLFYRNGIGVEASLYLSCVWFSVAAAQGNAMASSERDNAGAQLSSQALEEAQAQATRCFESNYQDCD